MDQSIYTTARQFAAEAKNILKENLVQPYLFGSYAKNESNVWSDIDILLIVKHCDYVGALNRTRKLCKG